jgi:hypothetical protein
VARRDPSKLCVRDLRPGMTVTRGGQMITVSSVTVMDGRNGESPRMMFAAGMPSAMAFKIEFDDHEPLYAHPGEVVATRH